MKAAFFVFAILFAAPVAWAEDSKSVTISNEGAMVMTIDAPQSAKIKTDKEKTVIDSKDMVLDLWVVPKAKSVDNAIASLDDLIKSEVLKFSAKSTEAITVAGAEGKHLKGTGIEADDQDPATVDIVVFTVGKTVMIACVHGEGEAAVRWRAPMLAALKTVKAP